MTRSTNDGRNNPSIESDDSTSEEKQGRRKRRSDQVEERPADRVRGQEEGNKDGPPIPTPDPAGGNL